MEMNEYNFSIGQIQFTYLNVNNFKICFDYSDDMIDSEKHCSRW